MNGQTVGANIKIGIESYFTCNQDRVAIKRIVFHFKTKAAKYPMNTGEKNKMQRSSTCVNKNLHVH